jgi:hypothetical protein
VKQEIKRAIDSSKKDAEISNLRRIIEKQADQIQRMRGSNFKLSIGKAKTAKGGRYCRLVIPDTHGSVCDPAAISAMLGDVELVKPSEVFWLGDHLVCSAE